MSFTQYSESQVRHNFPTQSASCRGQEDRAKREQLMFRTLAGRIPGAGGCGSGVLYACATYTGQRVGEALRDITEIKELARGVILGSGILEPNPAFTCTLYQYHYYSIRKCDSYHAIQVSVGKDGAC